MNSIFERISREDIIQYLLAIKNFREFDTIKTFSNITGALKSGMQKGATMPNDYFIVEKRWYDSLLKNSPDYSVYDDEYFIVETWVCWALFSRKYLLAINNKKSLSNNNSIVNRIGKIKGFVDLGCGIGYTTAGLKELFPEARGYGTNLKGTYQYRLAGELGKERDFTITNDINNIKETIDLVFASEYFEHIEDPIQHLEDVVNTLSPRFFIIANSFNSKAIGHFDTFTYKDKKIDKNKIGKEFNLRLKSYGYIKEKTNLWNNRPCFWTRT